jgi:manganese transport protein
MQLGFATIPLIHFVSDKEKMGEFAINTTLKILAWISTIIIVGLNIKLVYEVLHDVLQAGGAYTGLLQIVVIPIVILALVLLFYVAFEPWLTLHRKERVAHLHNDLRPLNLAKNEITRYQRIAVSVDFSSMDSVTIQHALAQGGKEAKYLLVHIVETAGARWLGDEIKDYETKMDKNYLKEYAAELEANGYQCEFEVGFGNRNKEIPRLVANFNADFMVMGGHGHQTLMDWVLGTTISAVRHSLQIPVLVVR